MKWPDALKNEAQDEAYSYFDKNIRQLKKTPDGKIDTNTLGLTDNDVDAFRHAYVSGVFTQEYSAKAAEDFGRLQEMTPFDFYSNRNNPRSRNMDLWNNAVGRKYGSETKNKKNLLKLIHKAMKNGELILTPEDNRQYEGAKTSLINESKPIIVLKQSKDGRNEIFYDFVVRKVLTWEEFVKLIEAGHYPNYSIKSMNGIATPVSNPDGRKSNNLG